MTSDDVTPAGDVLEARLQEQRNRILRAQGVCGPASLTAKHIKEWDDHGRL